MDFLLYLFVLVIAGAVTQALAPRPPRQRPPTLQEFDFPTVEEGRAIPWIFGTYKVLDPNIIWYGDLGVATQTRDKVKTRSYYLGAQMEICIGPVDAVVALYYGDKACWFGGELTASQQIYINQPALFGGSEKEGGIQGYFDLCFGEATQGVNDYLLAQIGGPLSAFRDSLTIVARKPLWAANTTLIKPLVPTVRHILVGWPDDTPWYPERAVIPDEPPAQWSYDAYASGLEGGTALACWWKMSGSKTLGQSYASVGTATAALMFSGASAASTTFDQPGITLHTEDGLGVHRGGGLQAHFHTDDRTFLGPSPMAIGCWRRFGDADQQIVIKTNTGGEQGRWRGIDVWRPARGSPADPAPTYLEVVMGANGVQSRRYKTPSGIIGDDAEHFIVLQTGGISGLTLALWGGDIAKPYRHGSCDDVVDQIELYVDGVLQPLTYHSGSETEVHFPVWASWPDGWNGVSFDGMGDTYGAYPAGDIDEPFIHDAALAPATIAELYLRGSSDRATYAGWDMNPAHIVYRALVDPDQGLGEPTSSIDDANFRYAADLFFEELLGFSFYWRNTGQAKQFIGEVLAHAGAVLSANPETGQIRLVPLRGDYDANALDLLTEDDVLEVVDWQDAADADAVNEVTVTYRGRDGKSASVTVPNRASIQQQGISHGSREYAGATKESVAVRLAQRDVDQSSSNLSKGKLKVNRGAWNKLPGSVFRFSHGPEQIEELVLRVMEIDTGTITSGTITVTVVQDIYSLPLSVPAVGEQGGAWVPPDTAPAAISVQDVQEAPYWHLRRALGASEADGITGTGYLLTFAGQPTGLHTDYRVWTRIGPDAFVRTDVEAEYLPRAQLTAELARTAAAVAFGSAVGAEQVSGGWFAMLGEGADAEIAAVSAIDLGAGTATLVRAVLDTTPRVHASGTRIWFIEPVDGWQRDETPRAAAEVVDVRLQSVTGAGELDIGDATEMTLTLASRAARPYPPGNVQLNGSRYPSVVEGEMTLTWAHRDRLAQALDVVAQDAASIGPEVGTSYTVRYYMPPGTLIHTESGITGTAATPYLAPGNGQMQIALESVRDGLTSWQAHAWTFDYFSAPGLLDAEGQYLQDAVGAYISEA